MQAHGHVPRVRPAPLLERRLVPHLPECHLRRRQASQHGQHRIAGRRFNPVAFRDDRVGMMAFMALRDDNTRRFSVTRLPVQDHRTGVPRP